jgi:hypothetical protein
MEVQIRGKKRGKEEEGRRKKKSAEISNINLA